MRSSLRLFWTGLPVLALGIAGCGGSSAIKTDGGGGAGGKTDGGGGSKPDGSAGAGGGTGGAKTDGSSTDAHADAIGIDTNVPPPAMLTATVLDRRATTFELLWTAPSNAGAAVAGYQIRYAKVPITTTNFDDTTMTTAATYTGTPKAPGDTDGTVVKAYIENGYYFAVTGTDAAGAHVGTFMATAAAVTAHFNQTLFPSTSGTNELLGNAIGAGDDVNKDGFSDILVGTYHSARAYLFFGSANFATGAPGVVFSGAAAGFGTEVAEIGDIDGDGFADLAIADPVTAEKVYIYKGRSTWPATLTDAQADYTVATDATYAGSNFGASLARLGDFTGDGIDDLAIGVRGFGTTFSGRVVIIPGKASGFTSVSLPDTSRAITIDGDGTQTQPIFGYRVAGLGRFYSVSSGTTLAVSAPGISATTPASAGTIYFFHGQTGTAGSIALASADQVITGPAMGVRIGLVLSNLGIVEGDLPNLGIGNPVDTIDATGFTGTAYLMFGTGSSTSLTNKVVISQNGATGAGGAIVGGSVSGRSLALSLIGDATPDIVVASESGATSVGIADGKVLATRSGLVNTNNLEVSIPVPSTFVVGEAAGSLVPDINGDGYPDFCLGEGAGSVPGSLAVFW